MSASGRQLKILCIDDDVQLLETLAEFLRLSLKAVVFTAATIPAAILAIEENGPFDVLVSDYQIPPHTALDLTAYLKANKIESYLILHSGYDQIDEAPFKNEKYLGLIEKPAHRRLAALIRERFPLSN